MLVLPDDIRKRIANEFRFAADKMAEVADLATKTYYFSAFFGELQRALNYAWSDELALVHLALQSTHQTIKGRIDMAIAGVEPGLGLAPEFAAAYTQFAQDIAALFEAKQIDEAQLHRLLCRAAALNYVVTGNGYYLYVKGVLTLDASSKIAQPSAQSRAAHRRKASRP